MGLYSGGLIIGRIFAASEIWGAYFREGLFFRGGGGLINGISWYREERREEFFAPLLYSSRFSKVSFPEPALPLSSGTGNEGPFPWTRVIRTTRLHKEMVRELLYNDFLA